VDHDFIPLYGIKVLAGSSLKPDRSAGLQPIVINEAGLQQFGLNAPDEAIGQRVARSDSGPFEFEIIGVIQNMHIAGLQSEVEPFFMKIDPYYHYITLQVETSGLDKTVEFSQKTWKKLFPGIPFEYYFLDEAFNQQYVSEERLVSLFRFFTFLGLFIACLGLYSLVTSTLMRRIKEVAIRKIVGASVPGITGILLKQYIVWVMTANIIAWPAAYYAMHKWLQNFAYRAKMNIWIFILSGLAALAIAVLTVSFQTIRAARANPVESLRYE
jgi:putative ABC transport system permease protein